MGFAISRPQTSNEGATDLKSSLGFSYDKLSDLSAAWAQTLDRKDLEDDIVLDGPRELQALQSSFRQVQDILSKDCTLFEKRNMELAHEFNYDPDSLNVLENISSMVVKTKSSRDFTQKADKLLTQLHPGERVQFKRYLELSGYVASE